MHALCDNSKSPDDITGIKPEETIYIGDTLNPEYVVEPERFAGETIKFEAADTDIISVNKKGQIKADKLGETTLTLTAEDYSEEVVVKVIAKVTDISNIDKAIKLTEGDEKTLSPKLSPKKFANEKITYSIKDSKIAKVSKDGRITALRQGTTELTISAGGYSENIKITVEEYVAPYVEPDYTYAPQYTYNTYSSGNTGGSSSTKSDSGSENGFFDSSDDEYF